MMLQDHIIYNYFDNTHLATWIIDAKLWNMICSIDDLKILTNFGLAPSDIDDIALAKKNCNNTYTLLNN